MKLILTRHGETLENQQGIMQGHLPGNLSDNGKEQVKKLALRLKDEKIDAIYCSELQRARDTAKEILKYHPDTTINYVEELKEADLGIYTGKHRSTVPPGGRPKEMEPLESMQKRANKLLDEAYKKYPNGTVLFVGHAGINGAFLTLITKKKHEELEKQGNTSVNIFEIKEDGNHIIHLINDTTHLSVKLPTKEQCYEFYKEIGTPDNIIRHVVAVNKIAMLLARKLKAAGININLDLVDRASFLHDLDKWLCLNNKSLKHGFETERILAEKGFPEVGFYARQHRADLVEGLKTWEEKIIRYADSRVLHDKVVSMKERYDDLNVRYPPKNPAKREKDRQLSIELEKEIFSKIDIKPEDVEKMI